MTIDSEMNEQFLSNAYSGKRYGEAGFVPCFETLREYQTFYEMFFIEGGGELGVSIVLPRRSGVDLAARDVRSELGPRPPVTSRPPQRQPPPGGFFMSGAQRLSISCRREAGEGGEAGDPLPLSGHLRAGRNDRVRERTARDCAECLALIDLLRSYPGAVLGVTSPSGGYVVSKWSEKPDQHRVHFEAAVDSGQ